MTEYTDTIEEPFDGGDDFDYMDPILEEPEMDEPSSFEADEYDYDEYNDDEDVYEEGDTAADDNNSEEADEQPGAAEEEKSAEAAPSAQRPTRVVRVQILTRRNVDKTAEEENSEEEDDEPEPEPEPKGKNKSARPAAGAARRGGATTTFSVEARPLTREQRQYLEEASGTFFAILEEMLRVYQREPSREGVEEIFQFAESLRTLPVGTPAPSDLLFDTLFAATFNGYDLRVTRNRIALLRLLTRNFCDGIVDATAGMHTALRTNQLLPRLLPHAPKDLPPFFAHCFACGSALCSTFDLITIERKKNSRSLFPPHVVIISIVIFTFAFWSFNSQTTTQHNSTGITIA